MFSNSNSRLVKPSTLLILAVCWVFSLLCSPGVYAHPASICAATAKVGQDGHFEVKAKFDLLAFVLNDSPQRIGDGPMNELLDGPPEVLQAHLAEAAQRFRKEFTATGGQTPGTITSLDFPSLPQVQAWRDSGIKPRLPVMLTVTVRGNLPDHAQTVSFRFPEVLGMLVLNTEFPFHEPQSEPLEPGAASTPLAIPTDTGVIDLRTVAPKPKADGSKAAVLPAKAYQNNRIPGGKAATVIKKVPVEPAGMKPVLRSSDPQLAKSLPIAVTSDAGNPKPESTPRLTVANPVLAAAKPIGLKLRGAHPAAPLAGVRSTASRQSPMSASVRIPTISWATKFFRYVQMGFHHILPEGTDHILFVLGLFLLSRRTKDLLWQISAFTVAHSITLALSLYGIVRLPSSIIEPVIALSIVFVAVENLLTTELKPWRPAVVFAFGLVHGMGFASALKDAGLQHRDFLSALVGFNVGVECGQLAVVGIAFLLVGWLRSRPQYRRLVVVPGSLAIAATALYWTAQRISLYYLPSAMHISF